MAITKKGRIDNTVQAQVRQWSQVARGTKVKFEDKTAEVLQFVTQPAVVRTSLSRTINLGNYESVRVECGVDLPCYVEEIPHAQEAAIALCEKQIAEMVDDIVGEPEKPSKEKTKNSRRR